MKKVSLANFSKLNTSSTSNGSISLQNFNNCNDVIQMNDNFFDIDNKSEIPSVSNSSNDAVEKMKDLSKEMGFSTDEANNSFNHSSMSNGTTFSKDSNEAGEFSTAPSGEDKTIHSNNITGTEDSSDIQLDMESIIDSVSQITPEQLKQVFPELESSIAYSPEDAANGQFIDPDNILSEYWVDKPLNFELQDNGTYAILQQDDSGNWVTMGYTSSDTITHYYEKSQEILGLNNNSQEFSQSSSISNGTYNFSSSNGIAP